MDAHRPEPVSPNVVEYVKALLTRVNGGLGLSVEALRYPGESDLAVLACRRRDGQASAERVSRVLAQRSEVASVRRGGRRLLVRLADDLLAQLGADLEAGERPVVPESNLLDGECYVVDFCDPNATKALHVGHLRNLALGNALASALDARGARVITQSQVGDAGHQIGEAMAGYLRYGKGSTPERSQQKSDEFVGQYYSAYAHTKGVAVAGVSVADLPVASEMASHDDLARSLMRRWQAGDTEIQQLRLRVRDWVMTGQTQTLSRLGISFDRLILESSYLPRIPPLVRSALERRIIAYAENGSLVYKTGDTRYPIFPLSGPDGFPNQNLRSLVICHELMSELRDATMLQVGGIEWRAHETYIKEILQLLLPDLPVQPARSIFCAMVSEGGRVVSSSAGNAYLIDDLLDDLAGRDELRALAIGGRSGCAPEDLAAIAALGFCLDQRITKAMSVTPSAVLNSQASAGSAFVRAWTKAWSPTADGAPAPLPRDPAYRFAVSQSQFYCDSVSRALESLDMLPIVRLLSRLSRWYLTAPVSASTARVMRSVLRAGFRDLGLLRTDR